MSQINSFLPSLGFGLGVSSQQQKPKKIRTSCLIQKYSVRGGSTIISLDITFNLDSTHRKNKASGIHTLTSPDTVRSTRMIPFNKYYLVNMCIWQKFRCMALIIILIITLITLSNYTNNFNQSKCSERRQDFIKAYVKGQRPN